jgi:hypothetical protein
MNVCCGLTTSDTNEGAFPASSPRPCEAESGTA